MPNDVRLFFINIFLYAICPAIHAIDIDFLSLIHLSVRRRRCFFVCARARLQEKKIQRDQAQAMNTQ